MRLWKAAIKVSGVSGSVIPVRWLIKEQSFMLNIREVSINDVDQLYQIEQQVFATDRLSIRRFKHWVKAKNRIFLVAEWSGQIAGYGLVLLHQGTRLARLYSIALAPNFQGQGIAKQLIETLEMEAAAKKRLFMRLEVAQNNTPAIQLYKKLGYVVFGTWHDYYDDHQDALRMQKRIRFLAKNHLQKDTPWYQQTTEFTCGPAALIMAMASLNPKTHMSQELELDLWREATTIFMTSGHGGCHPVGLALAAQHRGFSVEVYINSEKPLFLDSVRNQRKKEIMEVVDLQFKTKAKEAGIPIHYASCSPDNINQWLQEGAAILMLISTYRMDGKKAPHWVTVSGIDEECVYVHDPDPSEEEHTATDCQYLPISISDFEKMASFGVEKLRTCVIVRYEGG